jgi:hypothetical protein
MPPPLQYRARLGCACVAAGLRCWLAAGLWWPELHKLGLGVPKGRKSDRNN